MSNFDNYNESMEKGLKQLLGLSPVNSVIAPEPCQHSSDGFEYQADGARIVTLHCTSCGEFYDEPKK